MREWTRQPDGSWEHRLVDGPRHHLRASLDYAFQAFDACNRDGIDGLPTKQADALQVMLRSRGRPCEPPVVLAADFASFCRYPFGCDVVLGFWGHAEGLVRVRHQKPADSFEYDVEIRTGRLSAAGPNGTVVPYICCGLTPLTAQWLGPPGSEPPRVVAMLFGHAARKQFYDGGWVAAEPRGPHERWAQYMNGVVHWADAPAEDAVILPRVDDVQAA